MNISQHIVKVHKIGRNDERYANLLVNSTTVPKCYTKIAQGRSEMFTGLELEQAKASNEKDILSQQKCLNQLNKLRKEVVRLKSLVKDSDENDKESRRHCRN